MKQNTYNLEQIEALLLAVERGELSAKRAKAYISERGLTHTLPAHIVNEAVRELTNRRS